MTIGVLYIQAAVGSDWAAVLSRPASTFDPVLLIGLGVVGAVVCLASSFIVSSRRWAVAGHLACPCVWFVLAWPELATDVLARGDGPFLGYCVFIYLVAIVYWAGGLIGMHRRKILARDD